MDEELLIEDIISTKNTLTILKQVLNVNQNSLQPFSPILDSITELNDILTHSSVKQVEIFILSSEYTSIFNELKDTLNELCDAITTKNISTINTLNEQLSSFVGKFRKCSSNRTNDEKTADDIFKKNLLKSHIDTETKHESKCSSEEEMEMPVSLIEYNTVLISADEVIQEEKNKSSSIIDPFAQFRFSSRRPASISVNRNKKPIEAKPLPPPPPPPDSSAFVSNSFHDLPDSHSSKLPSDKPRLMISYNHASKPICMNIYNNLTNDGYEVWIDLEEMHGSTLTAMAQAIEESDIILYCVTELYSQSRNCQKEAEYAFVQQKIMIPLILQSHYKPKGWLGLLMGASLYIDFTKTDFTENYIKLKKEIDLNASRINNNKNEVRTLTLASTLTATNDQEQTMNKQTDGPSLQSPKTNSTSNVGQSRSCVLF